MPDDYQADRTADGVSHPIDGIIITDARLTPPGPRIQFVNDAVSRITGYPAEELMGESPDILAGELTDRAQLDLLRDNLARGSSHRCDLVIYRRDGTPLDVQLSVSPLCDAAGHCTHFVGTHRDITAHGRMAESLRDREERMRAILNTAVDAIITIDERGIIDSMNPATEEMFGYRREELVGKNISLLMPSPYREEHDGYLQRYMETGIAHIIGIGREVECRRSDGSVFPAELAVSEIRRLGLFTGFLRDITERKSEHERLIQSERLAALGEAMAGLTHESRNALARGQANLRRLARRLKGEDELLTLIDGALRANEDIRRQFEDVRQYAAPMTLQRTAANLPELVLHVWEELEPERSGRDAAIAVHGADTGPVCAVDGFLLGNAVRNILENSLAAVGDPVRIDVRFSRTSIGETPAIRMSICDNGPGLPQEADDRAFQPFFTTRTRGTGLGLAIVHRTVAAHGGTVSAGTGIGGGAEIVITIPAADSDRSFGDD